MHTARAVKTFLRDRGVVVMPWPLCSPGLNTIENLWGILTKRVYDRAAFPSADALWAQIQVEWGGVGQQLLHHLYDSMPNRVQAVLGQQGHPVHY